MEKLFEEMWGENTNKQEASKDKNKIIDNTHCVKVI